MNCDHAFDLMTDPSQDDCAELHTHLDECPRCQQMYETLSPALGLFDSAGCQQRVRCQDDVVAYDDLASGVEIAERVAVRLSRTKPEAPVVARSRRPRLLWACVMAGCIGFLSAIGLSMLQPAAIGVPTTSEPCTWTNRAAAPTAQRASTVVLSCVACHLTPEQQPQSTTSLWDDWAVPQVEWKLRSVEPAESMWICQSVWSRDIAFHV